MRLGKKHVTHDHREYKKCLGIFNIRLGFLPTFVLVPVCRQADKSRSPEANWKNSINYKKGF